MSIYLALGYKNLQKCYNKKPFIIKKNACEYKNAKLNSGLAHSLTFGTA